MSSRGSGLTLMAVVLGLIGYFIFQSALGINTKVDDIGTILVNSSSNSLNISIGFILVAIGLTVHGAGILSTRGTAPGTAESVGIYCIMTAILIWVTSISLGFAIIELADGVAAAAAVAGAAAAAGNAAGAAAAGFTANSLPLVAAGTQATNVAANTMGSLLAGIGWICIGWAYRGSDVKGALSFIPLSWLAILAGLILVVANLIIVQSDADLAQLISGISFILITLWSVSRGVALMRA